MRTAARLTAVLAALALVSTAALAFATQPTRTANGRIVRVDARTLTIDEGAAGRMVFTYNDVTHVTGADNVEGMTSNENVESLASMPGTSVTVHYRTMDGNNMAIQVDVHAKG